jgi:hypothetical protein
MQRDLPSMFPSQHTPQVRGYAKYPHNKSRATPSVYEDELPRHNMHLHQFGYAISRPYPFSWFSWMVIVGGISATVIFSILNLAATGYILQVQYTSDYNATMLQKHWTQRFPFSWLDKTPTTCKSQEIPVNSQVLTNKLALPYTLAAVWNNNSVSLPSLRYTNNILDHCELGYMTLDLESKQRTASEQGWMPWGTNAFVSNHISLLSKGMH